MSNAPGSEPVAAIDLPVLPLTDAPVNGGAADEDASPLDVPAFLRR